MSKESWLASYERGRAHGLSDGDVIAQAQGSAADPDAWRKCRTCGGTCWVIETVAHDPGDNWNDPGCHEEERPCPDCIDGERHA